MIKFKNIVFHRDSFKLLINQDFPLHKWITILGPSGCGKSTFIDVFSGFEKPSSGSIFINQQDITNLDPDQRPLGLMFQDHNIFEHLTIKQNIQLGFHARRQLSLAEQDTLNNVAKDLKILEILHKKPKELSGGQKQRIALCRILCQKKPILLLDEPCSHLDPSLREDVIDHIARIKKKYELTIFFVSHHFEDVKRHSDFIMSLENGAIMQFDKL